MARSLIWLAAVTVAALTPLPASAAPPTAPAGAGNSAESFDMAPGMIAAMKRDLHLTDSQIAGRLATEAAAPYVQKVLKEKLGKTYAGAWIPDGGSRLTVAVTDAEQADLVRTEGADVKVVQRSQAELDKARAAMDKHAKEAPAAGVRAYQVDVQTNSVVVMAAPGKEAAARKFAKDSGAGAVTVTTLSEQPRPLYDTRGGDQYVINSAILCSVGFPVYGGFVSAGHCGQVGNTTQGYNDANQGVFRGRSFPGDDYSYIQTNADWISQPWVNNYSGGNVTVAGSQEAAIGSSICRSGRTSGWRCGTILGRDTTVYYSDGPVYGMGHSNACAEPGDSGGAWISGNQAQGVTSGGSGNCSSGADMFYQPVNEILQKYQLSLTTTNTNAGAVVSNLNSKCLDVPGGNFSDGNQLQMWACNGSDAQFFVAGFGVLVTRNNKCVDVPFGARTNGVPLQIVTCTGNPAQVWVMSAAGDLVNPQSNKCMDIKDLNRNDGAKVQLWDCNGGANQKWKRR